MRFLTILHRQLLIDEESDVMIEDAPKIRATPTTMPKNQNHGMRPVSAAKPAAMTAMVATVVATVPCRKLRTAENALPIG